MALQPQFTWRLLKKPPQASVPHWSYQLQADLQHKLPASKRQHVTQIFLLCFLMTYISRDLSEFHPQEERSGISTSQTCPYQLPERDPNELCHHAQKIPFFIFPFFFPPPLTEIKNDIKLITRLLHFY